MQHLTFDLFLSGLSSTKEAYDVSDGKKPLERAIIGLGDQVWRLLEIILHFTPDKLYHNSN